MSDCTDAKDEKPKSLVTAEGQRRVLDEILKVYENLNIGVRCDTRSVPIHTLIATQDAIEEDKFRVVKKMVADRELDIPIVVEEHFVEGDYRRYVLDGHCRTRAHIELGRRQISAYVIWSEAGDFKSNFVTVAEQYGDVKVKDLKMV